MRELVIRHVGPVVVVTFEVGAVTRVSRIAESAAEAVALDRWIADSRNRIAAVALAAMDSDVDRAREWSRTLRDEGGGVADLLGRLADRIIEDGPEAV